MYYLYYCILDQINATYSMLNIFFERLQKLYQPQTFEQ